MWVLKRKFCFFFNLRGNVPYFYDTLVASAHPFFSICLTTHITFSADHGDQRLWPIPSPVARRRPSRVRWYHPHTMGDDAFARLCVIWLGARAVSPPPQQRICWFCFLGRHRRRVVILIVINICFSSFNGVDLLHIMLIDCCMLCCRESGPIVAVWRQRPPWGRQSLLHCRRWCDVQ